MNKRVQDAASKLVGKVYGKVFSSSDAISLSDAPPLKPSMTVEELAEQVDRLPNSEELATAFALLQADIDRQHPITRLLMGGVLIALLAVLATLIWMR
ncbi:MAG: hypothetical protein IPH79_13175 [Sphingomonadales bacterium]|nr:hypothetical protein [Sphingomonadales bacterium]